MTRNALVLFLGVVAAACNREQARPAFVNAPVILISIDTLRADHLPLYGYTKAAAPYEAKPRPFDRRVCITRYREIAMPRCITPPVSWGKIDVGGMFAAAVECLKEVVR
jgi:hypothetical protein